MPKPSKKTDHNQLKTQDIIDLLPYQAPFLFVEELTLVSKNGTEGYYTLKKTSIFIEVTLKIVQ